MVKDDLMIAGFVDSSTSKSLVSYSYGGRYDT
jgi:hypothetical protein